MKTRITNLRITLLACCTLFISLGIAPPANAQTYYVQSHGGTSGPPWPMDPHKGAYPLEQIGPDTYLVEDGDGSTSLNSYSMMSADSIDPNDTNSVGTNTYSNNLAPNIRNYAKYAAQVYTLLDTNSVLNDVEDTNLFNACAAINGATNGLPLLTIVPYGPDGVLIRADNFDYSQTNVDLALLVCDKVETPTWKAIDFNGTSDAQDGWLVQGTVPYTQVTSTMFFQVTNLNRSYNAFFKVIPYTGPQVAIIGTNQPYDTVSNVITLTTQIYDLSGTTNEEFLVDVNGDDTSTRSSLTNNTITIDTKYNVNGLNNVDLTVQGWASVYANGNTNMPGDTRLLYPSATSIPLDFENVNYLYFQSALADPDIGTNAILFYCGEIEDFTCTITDPSNNQVVASYGGTTPGPVIVEIDWNFTEADGVTPYTNTVYNVSFTASDPDTFNFMNQTVPANDGVRRAAGCFITYEQEPTITGEGELIDEDDQTWLEQTLPVLYTDIYDSLGVTQYLPSDIGGYRNFGACQGLLRSGIDGGHWADFMGPALSNSILDFVSGLEYPMYSDLTIGGAHGDGTTIGGYAAHTWIPWLHDSFTPMQLTSWLQAPNFAPEWRLRKAALWSCLAGQHPIYTAEKPGPHGETNDPPDFADGCGIRGQVIQMNNYVHKNSAWIIDNLLPEGLQGPSGIDSTPKVATFADELWAEGAFPFPGGCDPTYCTYWVVRQMRGMYPVLIPGADTAFLDDWGYIYLPYTAVQDTQLEMLNASGVKGKN